MERLRRFPARVARFEPLEERMLLAASNLVDLWDPVVGVPDSPVGQPSYVSASEFSAHTLDAGRLRSVLDAAPDEGAQAVGIPIALPNPDGGLERFRFVESPIMAPGLAEKFPEIRTFRGQGVDDPAATVHFDITPAGFHAQVLSPAGRYYIDPYYHLDDSLYASYFAADVVPMSEFRELEVHEHSEDTDAPAQAQARPDRASIGTVQPRTGAQLRTYRTAVAATGEYTVFHGGSVAAGQAAIVTAMNRVSGIYENELSIRLQLVANNDQLVYTNRNTDPYTNDDPDIILGQNQTNIDRVIGDANYDVGHVFTTSGGGLAALSVVGVRGEKARGTSGLSIPRGDPFYVDYVAHEMGHQFGTQHTFNGRSGACSGGRFGGSAYEPGSGSTIAAYAGICDTDDLQGNSDPYFHSSSFDQIINYVDNVIPAVGTRTATGNSVPTVDAGDDYTIPARTPFVLIAEGFDADSSDQLTYSWEQRDLGPQQSLNEGDNGSSPLFRSFLPTTNPSREFPRSPSVIGERLPTTTRELNFRATVRDNRTGGGGINSDDVLVNVIDTGAPFRITSPNLQVVWGTNTTQTVTWDVAGTTGNGINTSHVDILLSRDRGATFPIVLAARVPNDGQQDVVLPTTESPESVIRVRGSGNIFFDDTDTHFAILSTLQKVDYGDAPDSPYPTLGTNNGARHTVGGPFLGNGVDVETNGQPNATANGDGIDEDGIVFSEPLVAGATSNIQVTSSAGGGRLDYFFDFDGTGGFGNVANEVFTAVLSGGVENVPDRKSVV